jgi:hypothetical protein
MADWRRDRRPRLFATPRSYLDRLARETDERGSRRSALEMARERFLDGFDRGDL